MSGGALVWLFGEVLFGGAIRWFPGGFCEPPSGLRTMFSTGSLAFCGRDCTSFFSLSELLSFFSSGSSASLSELSPLPSTRRSHARSSSELSLSESAYRSLSATIGGGET